MLILAVILLVSSGAFAATPAGQELIGQKNVRFEGVDNTLLLEIDPETFGMDYKVERIEKDGQYYYATYTYLDLRLAGDAWQYQLQENVRKIPLGLKEDLGLFLAKELSEERDARVKDLIAAKDNALKEGQTTRTEVTEYSGLVGRTLGLAGQVFEGYEPVKRRAIPSPALPPSMLPGGASASVLSQTGDLRDVYAEYKAEHDPDGDDAFGSLDNCPDAFNPDQSDEDNDGLGDACDSALGPAPEDDYNEPETDGEEMADGAENAEDSTADGQILGDEITSVEIVDLAEDVASSTF